MTFAEKSKYLRKERNLSQIQLAEALNVSKACISMIEIGKNEPTANTLIRYADFFECSTDYLLGREDDFGIINIPLKTDTPPLLNPKEKELLEIFNSLAGEYQMQILEYARYFATRTNAQKKKNI